VVSITMSGTISAGRELLPVFGWQSTRETTSNRPVSMLSIGRKFSPRYSISSRFSARPTTPPYPMEHCTSPVRLAIRRRAAAAAMLSGSGLSCMTISRERAGRRMASSLSTFCPDLERSLGMSRPSRGSPRHFVTRCLDPWSGSRCGARRRAGTPISGAGKVHPATDLPDPKTPPRAGAGAPPD